MVKLRFKVPTQEDLTRKAREQGLNTLVSLGSRAAESSLFKYGTLYSAAKDTFKGIRRTKAIVYGVPGFIALLFGADPQLEQAGAYLLGYGAGAFIDDKYISKRPEVFLYTDHIEIHDLAPSAELLIIIDGVIYDTTKFTTPANFGTIDTTNNKLISDADGKFGANFATALATGEHKVVVAQADRQVEITVKL